ncbi:MurR/RpiR family transcriptional regulator [Gemmobacter fulvus]|nr:MurR/RpiR family transcriptional regulator [Gemmobacter fulvus]MDQ1849598.1 MurR/RpiR family transcriptional regulator [Gemmobacter fulvus]
MTRVDGIDPPDQPTPDLRQRLADSMNGATRTEKAIASYFFNNFKSLPFETAASAAQKIGVSEASIGRYCRGLGFRHFKDLKTSLQADLGDRAWLIGDRLRDFNARSRQGLGEMSQALEREVAAIVANYELAATPEFARVVTRLARTPQVFIAGFQTERGHATYLAHGLQYIRPGVQMADLEGGHFAEVLLTDPGQSCLVLIDGRRYSRLTRRLALTARAMGIPVTLITDPYCDWGRESVTEMFTVQTNLNQFWDATSPMSSLIGLIVNGVFNELGPEVEARMARVSSFYNEFIGHTGDPRGPLK